MNNNNLENDNFFYEKLLFEHEKLSYHRTRYSNFMQWRKIFFVLTIIVFILCYYKPSLSILCTAIPLSVAILLWVLAGREKTLYYDTFQKDFINYILNKKQVKYKYVSEGLSEDLYRRADFGHEQYCKYLAEDGFIGYINDKKCIISDVKTIAKDNNGNNVALFKGVVAYTNLNQRIPGKITIKENQAISYKKDRITTSNQTFNDMFEIYASDKLFATKIINEEIINRILNLRLVNLLKPEIVISEDSVFIRLKGKYLFEADLNHVAGEVKNIADSFLLIDELKALLEAIDSSINQVIK